MQFGGKGNPMPRGCHEIPEKKGVWKFGGLIKAVWHEKDWAERLILLDLGNDAIINKSGHSRFVRNENSNSPNLLDTQS